MKIPIFQWLQIYRLKICDENEWRTTLKCSISSWNSVWLLQIVITVLWMYRCFGVELLLLLRRRAVPQDPKYCNLNRTINALWLRQPHYNPLFTGTTEVDVRRWDGSSALSHWASADCAISVLPRAHNVPYFPAGVSFFVPFQCTIPSSSSVILPPQNRRTHLQSI